MNRRHFLRCGAAAALLSSVGAQELYDYNPVTGSTSVILTKRDAKLPPVKFRALQAARFQDSGNLAFICGSPAGNMMTALDGGPFPSVFSYNQQSRKWQKSSANKNEVRVATKGVQRPYAFTHLSSDRRGIYVGVSFYEYKLWMPSVTYFTQGRAPQCLIHPSFYQESAKRTRSKPTIHISTGANGSLWSVSGQWSAQAYHGSKVDVLRGYWEGTQFRTQPMVIKFQGPTPPAYSLFQGCADWKGGYVFYTGKALWRLDAQGVAKPLVKLQVATDGSTYGNPAVDANGDIWIPVVWKLKTTSSSQGLGKSDVYVLSSGRSRLVRVRIGSAGTHLQEISSDRFLGALGLDSAGVMKTYRVHADPHSGGIVGYDSHHDVAFSLKGQ